MQAESDGVNKRVLLQIAEESVSEHGDRGGNERELEAVIKSDEAFEVVVVEVTV